MKTKLFLFAFCIGFANIVFAQLKVVAPGNVGIGTSAPQAKLHLVGNAVFSLNPSLGTTDRAPLIRGANTYSTASTPSYTWYNNNNTGIFNPIHDVIGFSVAGVERMRINNTGNVCIGIASAQSTYKLYVSGFTRFKPTSIDNGIVIDNIGYNGKSTISPEYGWNANLGDVETNRLWAVIACDHIFYNQITDMSPDSKKINIRPVEDALSKIMRLNGIIYDVAASAFPDTDETFQMELVEKNKNRYGFLVEDMSLICPDVVSEYADQQSGIDYFEIIPILVEAMKDQQAQIDELQHQIANLSGVDLPTTDEAKSIGSRLNPHSAAKKSQNISIGYYIDKINGEASMLLFDMQGKLIDTYPISNPGDGQITLPANTYPAGMYLYSLVVDGNEIATQKIILTE